VDSKLDFAGLAAALLARARMLVTEWLPGGALSGREYVCADIRGGRGRSFSVNVETGKWGDFADSELKGGDLISLYAAINGIKQGEAAKQLADLIGFRLGEDRPAPASNKERVARITAPPPEAPAPSLRHPRFGAASTSWTYRDDSGSVLFHIARYEPAGERKQFVPWCWDADFKKWVGKAWPKPRPIYGLELLSMEPEKPVLIVEGEKACDAARSIVDSYIVVTWPGGAAAWRDIDWTPLHGRRLLLWPDADRHVADDEAKAKKHGVAVGDLIPYEKQPGPAAMAGIAAILHGQTPEIKVIDVGVDTARPDGWDAADAVAGGWNWDDFYAWAKPRLGLFGPAPAPPSAVDADQVISPDAPPPELGELADRLPKGRNLYAEWERLGVATAQNGSPICNVDNALRVIEGREEFKGLLWYDEFHKRYLTRFSFDTFQQAEQREWSDVDELNLTAFMQRQLGLRRMSDDMVHKAAVIYAHQHMRNEPRDWMEALKWDGKPRVEGFFTDCFGVPETDYVKAASRNFWIGMAARVYLPGCQLDNMVVLEGGQGIGKTRALRLIGGTWYTEAKEAVTSRDFFMVLHGKLVVEIAELDSFNKAEVTRIKQVVTSATDRYRSPYARGAQDHPRMSIFIGTTNDQQYLRDNTGARRFWPMRCGAISHAKIIEQREQLYAEAVAAYKKWARTRVDEDGWWLMPALETAKEQEDRRMVDEWELIVADHLANADQTTTRDVAGHLKIETAKLDMVLQKRIAGVLRTLGWEKKTVRAADGKSSRVWRREGAPAELPLRPDAPPLLVEESEPF
jgi:putative DNA primase/helicase